MLGELNKLRNRLKNKSCLKKDSRLKVMKARMNKLIHKYGMEREGPRACAIGLYMILFIDSRSQYIIYKFGSEMLPQKILMTSCLSERKFLLVLSKIKFKSLLLRTKCLWIQSHQGPKKRIKLKFCSISKLNNISIF